MSRESDAEKCRRNGWGVGTVLEGDEGYGPTRIVLTAIGEEHILARCLSQSRVPCDGSEENWALRYREWKAVGDGAFLLRTTQEAKKND